MHLTFGLTHVIGFDVMNLLFELAMADPLFRSNIPLPEAGQEARRLWLNEMADRLHEIAKSDVMADNLEFLRDSFRYYRGGFDLPADGLEKNTSERFSVVVSSLEVVDNNGQFALRSAKGEVPIPPELADPITWIIARGDFSPTELAAQFPGLQEGVCDKLVDSLMSMKAIAPSEVIA
jgi:hypothetical protein